MQKAALWMICRASRYCRSNLLSAKTMAIMLEWVMFSGDGEARKAGAFVENAVVSPSQKTRCGGILK